MRLLVVLVTIFPLTIFVVVVTMKSLPLSSIRDRVCVVLGLMYLAVI